MSWAPGNSRDPPAVIGAYEKRRRHSPVHGPWTLRRDDDLLPRLVAAAATLALLVLASLIAASHRVLGAPADHSVSVPVTLRPYDPEMWALVNADDFAA